MKKTFLLWLCLILSGIANAQIYDPVKWDYELKQLSDEEVELIFKATIESPWHLYDMQLPEGGPTPTSITFEKMENGKLKGEVECRSKVHREFDKSFEMELGWYTDEAIFAQKVSLTDKNKKLKVSGNISYMVCNDKNCLPPSTESFSFGEKEEVNVVSEMPEKKTVTAFQIETVEEQPHLSSENESIDYWRPVFDQWKETEKEAEGKGLLFWLSIFFAGMAGGLFALFTPCVWPIIPMTVSFFLKRSGNKGKRDAILYGVSIVVIYVALGLLITLLFGASGLNSLSTNAFFNLVFFAMLVVFAVSFFGAFDITLPASWSNSIDSRAGQATGVLSIFLMAFTLALVSFSCTGPIIGTLLVEVATTKSLLAPAVGMAGFAIALAIPFSLFALFPSFLKSAPKSGGWLNSVKVVLGFLELALSLKFFSVADQAYGWGLLDREIFLVLWIVIFVFMGLYLIGKIKFSHDSTLDHVSVPRLFLSMISFAFAMYMVPGLWGAPLRGISAFSPSLCTQDFNLYDKEVHAMFDDYDTGIAYAAKVGKPVLVDFSGYGCVNCRKMETAVWIDPKVRKYLTDDYVLITLMVDDKTKLPEPMTVVENGKEKTLKTIGDKWSYLQRVKFGTNTQPFYVPLDNVGNPLSQPYSYNEDIDKYVRFLEKAIATYRK